MPRHVSSRRIPTRPSSRNAFADLPLPSLNVSAARLFANTTTQAPPGGGNFRQDGATRALLQQTVPKGPPSIAGALYILGASWNTFWNLTCVLQSKWPAILALGALGVSAWGLFMVFVTNQEKLSSSIMQQIMNTVKENPELREVLGEAIRPEPVWWMNGDPWIDGAVRTHVHIVCLYICSPDGARRSIFLGVI